MNFGHLYTKMRVDRLLFMIDLQQHHRYAEDREEFLRLFRRKNLRFWVPAQIVREAILQSDYRIERVDGLEPGVLGLCVPEQGAVLIPRDFQRRLLHPQTSSQVMHQTLAHELGHIRLHGESMKRGVKEPGWEAEAELYAQVFLVPRYRLLKCLETQALLRAREFCQSVRWGYILRLAEEFRVTGSFMAKTLQMYGLINLDRARRFVSIPQRAQESSRLAFG